MTDFKPGDVVAITEYGGADPAVRVDADCGVSRHLHAGPHWHYLAHARSGAMWCSKSHPAARRLVVIDPESDPDVIRLENALEAQGCRVGMGVQAALREFATPTPPRPDEPTGLGAVVEDADGLKWVSVEEMPPFGRWYCGVLPDDDCSIADGAFREWSALSAVRVLSEGIQP